MSESSDSGALPATPRIDVVVITRNEGDELRETVANLQQTAPPGQVELIVVDDASTDGSTGFLDSVTGVRVLRLSGEGVARARNFGAAHSTGDIVLFADAHVRAPQDWHVPIADALRDQAVGAVAPGIYSLTDPKCRGFGMSVAGPDLRPAWMRKAGTVPYPVPVLPGCFLAMRRQTYQRTGGYDPGMRQLGGNDAELSCRLWLSGYEQRIIPELEVGHLFRSAAPYPARWSAVLHNRLRMALVHFRVERVERVVQALRAYEAFPAAVAMTVDTDVHERRALLARTRSFDDDWFFERFSLAC